MCYKLQEYKRESIGEFVCNCNKGELGKLLVLVGSDL